MSLFTKQKGAVAKLSFATALYSLIFKYNYLQLNTSLTEKSTIFPRIFTFPQTISLSNTKKSVMRGHTFIGLALQNIPRNHGWIAFPPYPLARIAAASSARLQTILTLERAHTRPYTDLRYTQIRPQTPGSLALISGRLRGTFPLGLPECIRQTALPCVRGPDRAPRLRRGCCWLAALCLGVLQQLFDLSAAKVPN